MRPTFSARSVRTTSTCFVRRARIHVAAISFALSVHSICLFFPHIFTMSALDQIMMEDIARNCPQQFLAFHQCMSKPPSEADCVLEQKNLSLCIKTSVPVFQRIQGLCAGKLQAYEACLRMNASNQGACEGDLKSLRDCALGAVAK